MNGFERRVYRNGNYLVYTGRYSDKVIKRCLRVDEEFEPEFPDSIDLKITDCCNIGCPYCHESSNPHGGWYDWDKITEVLSHLPKEPIEISVGGGDLLEDIDKSGKLISYLDKEDYLVRATLNSRSVVNNPDKFVDFMEKSNLEAIGISIRSYQDKLDFIKTLNSIDNFIAYSIVYHIIAGLFKVSDFEKLITPEKLFFGGSKNIKILILGYKQQGRAASTEVPEMEDLKKIVHKILDNPTKYKHLTIGFDNLAIKQLDIKDHIDEDTWNILYQGSEFSVSMYIDAVTGKFAPSSTAPDDLRESWDNTDIINFFKNGRNSFNREEIL